MGARSWGTSVRRIVLAGSVALVGLADRASESDSVPHLAAETFAGRLPETILDAVTFYLSFDDGTLTPQMAGGDRYEPALQSPYDKTRRGPEFASGLRGQALVLGTGAALIPRKGNLTLERQGAVALWVKPVDWKRPNGSNVVFVMTSRGRFYLQMQGPARNADGKITRHEHVQFLAKGSADQKRYTGLMGGAWTNGQWYFLVANWSWPTMSLSINGAAFATKSLPSEPPEGLFGDILVGARGGDRGLIDEIRFFRRPLTPEEVDVLYEHGRAP